MNYNDLRVSKLRNCLRLERESLDIFIARQSPTQNHLHSNHAVQTHMPRFVHDPHAPMSDLVEQLVIAKSSKQRTSRSVASVARQIRLRKRNQILASRRAVSRTSQRRIVIETRPVLMNRLRRIRKLLNA